MKLRNAVSSVHFNSRTEEYTVYYLTPKYQDGVPCVRSRKFKNFDKLSREAKDRVLYGKVEHSGVVTCYC